MKPSSRGNGASGGGGNFGGSGSGTARGGVLFSRCTSKRTPQWPQRASDPSTNRLTSQRMSQLGQRWIARFFGSGGCDLGAPESAIVGQCAPLDPRRKFSTSVAGRVAVAAQVNVYVIVYSSASITR